MAPINPPTYQQASTYSARMDRLAIAGLMAPNPAVGALAPRGGVRPTPSNTGLQVTQRSTPAMFVTIAAGTGYVPAQSATGGVYEVHNDAAYDVAITAAHASLARKDLIVARVNDAEYSGVVNNWTLEAITGTPAGSPTLPATPAGAIALAQVQVNAAATTITNGVITDLRAYTTALGGTIPALSTALPASPYEGMAVYQTDTNYPRWFNGTSWHSWTDEGYQTAANVSSTLDSIAWQTYTPIWAASTANPSIGNGSIRGRYMRLGKMVHVQAWVGPGSTTTFGTGFYSISLPIAAKDGWFSGSGNPFGMGGGVALFNDTSPGNIAGGTAFLWDVGSGTPDWRIRMLSDAGSTISNTVPWTWANGDDFQVDVWYEID